MKDKWKVNFSCTGRHDKKEIIFDNVEDALATLEALRGEVGFNHENGMSYQVKKITIERVTK